MPVSKMRVKSVIYCLVFLCLGSTAAQSQGWRGLVPLHTTRAEVERVLGQPATDRGHITFYEFDRERVSFEYARGACGSKSSGWNVPNDTVISIWVTPKPRLLRFKDLNLDLSKFKKEGDKEVGSIVNYINEVDGVSYQIDTGVEVTLIKYFPAKKDSNLRCPSSGESLVDTTKFRSYSDMPISGENKLLDEFVRQLRLYGSADGYVMVYAGRRARVGEAEERGRRAREYLIKVGGIDGRRVVTIDGGYREAFTVELFLVPPGATPPLSTPTVDPREVRIINKGNARRARRSTRPR